MREIIGLPKLIKKIFHRMKEKKMTLLEAYEKVEAQKKLFFEELPEKIEIMKAARDRQLQAGLTDIATNTTKWIDFLTSLQKRHRSTQMSQKFGI